MRVEEVSPKKAAQWLRLIHRDQRKIRHNKVEMYASQMKRGLWRLIPEPIVFDVDGRVIQGQHRIHAQVKAGVTISYYVIRNAPNTPEDPFDRGATRNEEDRWKWARGIAPIIRQVGAMETGSPSIKRDMEDLPEIYQRNRQFIDAMHREFFSTKRTHMTTAVLGALVFAMPIDPSFVVSFATSLKTGENLVRGNPIHTLREWILERKGSGGGQYKTVFGTCLALRAAFKKEQLQRIRLTPAGYHYICELRRERGIEGTPSLHDEIDESLFEVTDVEDD